MSRKISSRNRFCPVPTTKFTFEFVFLGTTGAYTNLLVFKNKMYAFGLQDSAVATSTDGVNFSESAIGPVNIFLRRGWASATTMMLAGDYAASIPNRAQLLKSTDGVNWTGAVFVASGVSTSMNSVMANGTTWVAVGSSGIIYYSGDDGVTFNSVTSGTTWDLQDVAYGNGFWIAAGHNPSTLDGVVLKSTNGTTWTTVTGHGLTFIKSVYFANGVFVFNNQKTTTDAVTFTPITFGRSGGSGGFANFFESSTWLTTISNPGAISYLKVAEQPTDRASWVLNMAEGYRATAVYNSRPFVSFQNKLFYGSTSCALYSAPIV
jgi:hypothetical protein